MMLREKMETFNIRVNRIIQRPPVVAGPEEFQPFDLQALRNSVDNMPRQSSSRLEAPPLPQTA